MGVGEGEGEGEMRFRIGYAMLPEKVSSVVQPSLVFHSKQQGIDLIQVDLSKPLVDQGPFDCLVHKLYTSDWKRQLVEYQSVYPDTIVIDSPSAIERLHNRESMLEVVNTLPLPQSETNISIGIPRQVVANDVESLLSESSLALNFPVIAKPLLANGNDLSHEMCLVFNANALNQVMTPVVLQEFVNHGGVLFKVYVAGEHVKCVKRTSLPDVSDCPEGEGGIMYFSQISTLDATSQHHQPQEPPIDFIHSIAKGLRDATTLHLFNFDMIRDVKAANDKFLIIDINYLPGYAKLTGYENMLTDFFCDIVTHNQVPLSPDSGCSIDVAKNDDTPPVVSTPEPNMLTNGLC